MKELHLVCNAHIVSGQTVFRDGRMQRGFGFNAVYTIL